MHCVQDRTFYFFSFIRTLHSHEINLLHSMSRRRLRVFRDQQYWPIRLNTFSYITQGCVRASSDVLALPRRLVTRPSSRRACFISYCKLKVARHLIVRSNNPLLSVWARGAQIIKGLVVPRRPRAAKAVHRFFHCGSFRSREDITWSEDK